MLMPSFITPVFDAEPLWLQLNPSWREEIVEFSRRTDVDILDTLQTFGRRMRYNEVMFEDEQLFWVDDDVYWETEPDGEEGWATEHQVRWSCRRIYTSPNLPMPLLLCLPSHS